MARVGSGSARRPGNHEKRPAAFCVKLLLIYWCTRDARPPLEKKTATPSGDLNARGAPERGAAAAPSAASKSKPCNEHCVWSQHCAWRDVPSAARWIGSPPRFRHPSVSSETYSCGWEGLARSRAKKKKATQKKEPPPAACCCLRSKIIIGTCWFEEHGVFNHRIFQCAVCGPILASRRAPVMHVQFCRSSGQGVACT